MDDYTQVSFNDFLDRIGDRTPTPGGGGVAAAAGALACAMAKMVTNYSVGKKSDDATRKRVEDLAVRLHRSDEIMRGLITQDARAYLAMTEAGKTARDDPSRKPDHQRAILEAIGIPMEIAATSSCALATMDEFKKHANPYLVSDLGVAVALAEATARAAAFNVRVNLRDLADGATRIKILSELETILEHAAAARESIEWYVNEQLEL